MTGNCTCCCNSVAADAERCACGAVKKPSALRHFGAATAMFAAMAFAALAVLVPARLNQFGLDVPEWNPGETSTSGKILFFLVIAAIFTAVRNRLVARKRPAP